MSNLLDKSINDLESAISKRTHAASHWYDINLIAIAHAVDKSSTDNENIKKSLVLFFIMPLLGILFVASICVWLFSNNTSKVEYSTVVIKHFSTFFAGILTSFLNG
jgi:hypothetical protein